MWLLGVDGGSYGRLRMVDPAGSGDRFPSRLWGAVTELVGLLPVAEVNWAFTGSVGHRLAGVDVGVGGDVDVQTDEPGAYEAERRLGADAIVEPVRLREGELVRSHLGRAEVGGVPVEIIGALQKRSSPSRPWGKATDPADHRRFIELDGLRVPVLDLAYEADAYDLLGRKRRAALLRQAAWNQRTCQALESAYLSASDPFGGSGFRGDAERWRRARRVIVEAIHRDGTFLDVGCANGLLMESVAVWAHEEGCRVEPYGLELSPAIAEEARRRLPHWAQRIYVGDVTSWEPPQRFDFVRTELVYAPEANRRELVRRCLASLVAAGGRLIVCSYGSATRPSPRAEPVDDILAGWGLDVVGSVDAADTNGVAVTRIAWIDRDT